MRFLSSAPSPVKPLALETPPTPPHTLHRDLASRETRPGRKEAPPPAPLPAPSTRNSLAHLPQDTLQLTGVPRISGSGHLGQYRATTGLQD